MVDPGFRIGSSRFFQNFPQELAILHNFCTMGHYISIADNLPLPQSGCIETLDVLNVCWNIAADQRFRQFSRVNCWRVSRSAFVRSGCPGGAASSDRSSSWQDRAAGYRGDCRFAPADMLDVTFLENATHSACAPSLARWQGRAGHLRAMRLEWLAQAAFFFSQHFLVLVPSSPRSASSPLSRRSV